MASEDVITVQEVSVATTTPRLQPEEGIKPLDLADSEAVSNLARGFLAVLEPELVRVHRSLEELVVNQDEMLASVRDKRLQFEDTTKMTEITTLLQRLPQCRQNVSVLAKQMQTLSKRVKRLQVCEWRMVW
ncbi:hypothetical protein GBAR_LOCUS19361 [Geodia barretti]|uniref:Uncharacterized protein n=1 Tax=Geodia barretti TaxID=519541 RepID=A0AA35WZH3_GEOBA|nr:hypothetical protein GBAR_LOCUS19361 [Geodia barretti]